MLGCLRGWHPGLLLGEGLSAVRVSTPVERALEERARLGLSSKAPTPDMLGLIENVAKVPVIVQQLGNTGIAGAYAVRRGLPFIFVNGSMPTVRARFTLAHEYGHHVLKHGLSIDKVINIAGKQPAKEVEANSFAAEFLLPLEALDAWLRDRDYPDADLKVVVELARDFLGQCPCCVLSAPVSPPTEFEESNRD